MLLGASLRSVRHACSPRRRNKLQRDAVRSSSLHSFVRYAKYLVCHVLHTTHRALCLREVCVVCSPCKCRTLRTCSPGSHRSTTTITSCYCMHVCASAHTARALFRVVSSRETDPLDRVCTDERTNSSALACSSWAAPREAQRCMGICDVLQRDECQAFVCAALGSSWARLELTWRLCLRWLTLGHATSVRLAHVPAWCPS